MITHRNLASNALALVQSWGFTRGDVLLHALPIYHVHGLFVAIHCVLMSGSRMLWLPRFEPKEVVALLPRATAMMGVPTFYTRLLAEPSFTRAACAACACSSPARRRSCPRRSASSRSAPDSASSSATA